MHGVHIPSPVGLRALSRESARPMSLGVGEHRQVGPPTRLGGMIVCPPGGLHAGQRIGQVGHLNVDVTSPAPPSHAVPMPAQRRLLLRDRPGNSRQVTAQVLPPNISA